VLVLKGGKVVLLISYSRLLFIAAFFCACLVPLTGAFAQAVVAPACPQGYVLSGNQCVLGAPTPSCPAGYTLSGGQCVQNSAAPSATATREFGQLNCNQLWHARNKIFAEHGYCFKSAHAKTAFPNNCFPPYGKNLPAWAKNDVGWIKEVEKNKRC